MIRVVYRWQVAPANLAAFREKWRETTNHIHQTVPGALGSVMLKSVDTENEILTIAKWDSLTSWQAFWGEANREQMRAMRELGVRVSVQAFEEIEDHTK